ncbi:MAG: single-stranded DNA-binding protein [Bacteroidales bacterium]
MKSIRNQVQLIGRLGADPEVKTLDKGLKVARLSLATHEVIVKNGRREEQTLWHRLIVWGKQAETCEKFLKKGREIAISGRLAYNTWKDDKGQTHSQPEIVVNEVVMLSNPARA